jgi:hypothetical protein
MNEAEDCILTNQIALMEALSELYFDPESKSRKRLLHRIKRTSHFLDTQNFPGRIKLWEEIKKE